MGVFAYDKVKSPMSPQYELPWPQKSDWQNNQGEKQRRQRLEDNIPNGTWGEGPLVAWQQS